MSVGRESGAAEGPRQAEGGGVPNDLHRQLMGTLAFGVEADNNCVCLCVTPAEPLAPLSPPPAPLPISLVNTLNPRALH